MPGYDTEAGQHQARTPSMSAQQQCTAAHPFFSIAELLEMTLLDADLPRLQVMSLQRVNKFFQATILNSPELQRKLMLSQRPCPAGRDPNDFYNNPLSPPSIIVPGAPDGESWWLSTPSQSFRLPGNYARIFDIGWITHTTDSQHEANPNTKYQALRLRSQTAADMSMCAWSDEDYDNISSMPFIPEAFLKTHLSGTRYGCVVDLESESFDLMKMSRMWAPAVTTLGGVLEAYCRWLEGELNDQSGKLADGKGNWNEIFLDGNMGGEWDWA